MTVVRELDGVTWYVEARYYPSATMAVRAWEHAERKLIYKAGDAGVGVTRLAPNPENENRPLIESGLAGKPMHALVVVTRDERGLRRAQRILGGTSWTPEQVFCDAIIRRRIAVEASQQGHGRLIIRRPENRGARIYEDGQMVEQAGGQG